jgi:hypothetical protein
MPDPTAPAPTAPATPAPATPIVPPMEGTAGDLAARLRAHAGLPATPRGAPPDPKGVPSPAAAPAGTPPAPSTESGTDKPADKPPEEPKKSDGQLALDFVREQKARVAAEGKARELEQRLKAGETEWSPVKTAREKWAAGNFPDAIREAFGNNAFSDDLLVQLASFKPEPEQLTEQQLTERIRTQLKTEMKVEQDAQAARLTELREAAVGELGEALTKNPEKWPTVWQFGISGEQIAAAMDASYSPQTGKTKSAEEIFDQLEQDYQGKARALPYWAKDAAPPPAAEPPPPAAPRSFGTESRRGPVPTAEPMKPQTAEERWEARRKADAEWKAKTFGAHN